MQASQQFNIVTPSGDLLVELEEGDQWQKWDLVEDFQRSGASNHVYVLDPDAGEIRFGDGGHGARPAEGQRIRATYQASPNRTFSAKLSVTDTAGSIVTDTIQVTVNNLLPEIAPVDDRETNEGQPIAFTTTFSDPGVLDTHSATIDWGDGSVEDASIEGANGAGTVSGAHVYIDDGSYDVSVTVQTMATQNRLRHFKWSLRTLRRSSSRRMI